MMMTQIELDRLTTAFLEAWNTQNVEAVVACYTPDLVYRDPNTRGDVVGAEALRHYLKKLFAGWQMRWVLREAHAFSGSEGAAVLWRASFQKRGLSGVVEADGMDLVCFAGQRIRRNEVYFDRTVLSSFLPVAGPGTASA